MPPKKKVVKKQVKRTTKQAPKKTPNVIVNVNSNNKKGNTTTNKKSGKTAQMPIVVSTMMPAVASNPSPAPDVNRAAEIAQLRHEMQQGLNYTLAHIQAQQQAQQAQQQAQQQVNDEVSVEEEIKPSPLQERYLAQQREQVQNAAKQRMGLEKVKGTPRKAVSEYQSAQGTPIKPMATRSRAASMAVSASAALGNATGQVVRGAASMAGSLAKGLAKGLVGKGVDEREPSTSAAPQKASKAPSIASTASTATIDIANQRLHLAEQQKRKRRVNQDVEKRLTARLREKMEKKGIPDNIQPIEYARQVNRGKK